MLFVGALPVDPPSGDSNNSGMATEKMRARKVLITVGKKIADARRAKGWTRTQLARKAHVTVATVRGCETGAKVTQMEKMRQIAEALGLSLKRLETDETTDPRVRNWWDEDYVIGSWYHEAPRALKNRIWALQDTTGASTALLDPQFLPLLDRWAALNQRQKTFILSNFQFAIQHPDQFRLDDEETGSRDATTSPHDAKIRGPR
jgi:transcriptional regulator with XRE-family HTH domain